METLTEKSQEGQQLKKLKADLRISKKAEQIAKEKLIVTKRTLEKVQNEFAAYRQDSEKSVDQQKAENSLLQEQLRKALAESNLISDRASSESQLVDSSKTLPQDDLFKVIDEYKKQVEDKQSYIDQIQAKMVSKKEKLGAFKTENATLKSKVLRMESKLENMGKFSRILLKSIKSQSESLREQVVAQQADFSKAFSQTCQTIEEQIKTRLTHQDSSFKRQQESELKATLARLEDTVSQVDSSRVDILNQSASELDKHLQQQVQQLQSKQNKLKQKLTTAEESLTKVKEERDLLKVLCESEKTRVEITLKEREKQLLGLEQQILAHQQKEVAMSEKYEKAEQRAREEHQRLLQTYEGQGRYKDIREVYEGKLDLKQAELIKVTAELKVSSEKLTTEKESFNSKIQESNKKAEMIREELLKKLEEEKLKYNQEICQLNEEANEQKATFEGKIKEKDVKIDELTDKIKHELEKYENLCTQQSKDQLFIKEISQELQKEREEHSQCKESNSLIQMQINDQKDVLQTQAKRNLESEKQELRDQLQVEFEARMSMQEARLIAQCDFEKKELEERIDNLQTQIEELKASNASLLQEKANNQVSPRIQSAENDQNSVTQELIIKESSSFQDDAEDSKEDQEEQDVFQQSQQITKRSQKDEISMHDLQSEKDSFRQQPIDGDKIEKEVEIKEKFTADMMPPRPMIRPIRPNMPRGRAPRGMTPIRPQTLTNPQPTNTTSSSTAPGGSIRPRATLPSAAAGRKPRAQSQAPQMTHGSPFGQTLENSGQNDQSEIQSIGTKVSAEVNPVSESEIQQPELVESTSTPPKQTAEDIKPIQETQAVEQDSIKDEIQTKVLEVIETEKKQKLESPKASQIQASEKQIQSKTEEEEKKDVNSEQQATAQKISSPAPTPSSAKPPRKASKSKKLDYDAINRKFEEQNNKGSIFDSVMSSFMGLLGRHKQSHLGRSASGMYFDKEKNRYRFEGDSSSSESEEVEAPPTVNAASKKTPEQIEQEKKEEEKRKEEATGIASLQTAAFGGALSRGNRRARQKQQMGKKPANLSGTAPKIIGFVPPTTITPEVNQVQSQESQQKSTADIQQNQITTVQSVPKETVKIDHVETNEEVYKHEPNIVNDIQQETSEPRNKSEIVDTLDQQAVVENQGNNTIVALESLIQNNNDSTMNSEMYKTTFGDTLAGDSLLNLAAENTLLANHSMASLDTTQDNQILQNQSALTTYNEAAITNQNQSNDSVWQQRNLKLRKRISNFKEQIKSLQKDLRDERAAFKQTIESLEEVSVQLQSEGEKYQGKIKDIEKKLTVLQDEKTIQNFVLSRLEVDKSNLEKDHLENQSYHQQLKEKLHQTELELQKAKFESKTAQVQIDYLEEKFSAAHKKELDDKIGLLEVVTENQAWQITSQNIEKIELQNESMAKERQLKAQMQILDQTKLEMDQLKNDHKTQIAQVEQIRVDSIKKADSEQASLRELVEKLQLEKQRMQSQLSERQSQVDKTKKEAEVQLRQAQLKFQRMLTKKEQSFEAKEKQMDQEYQSKMQKAQQLMSEKTEMAQKLNLRLQKESQAAEKQIKAQLASLEGILRRKDEDLSTLKVQQKETTDEIETSNVVRDRLHDHIIYLQNEVRKRDQLLEDDGSDFENEEDFGPETDSQLDENSSRQEGGSLAKDEQNSSSQQMRTTSRSSKQIMTLQDRPKRGGLKQILSHQLEETRKNLQTEIESKLRAEQLATNLDQRLQKLREGLFDAKNLVQQQLEKYSDLISDSASAASDHQQNNLIRNGQNESSTDGCQYQSADGNQNNDEQAAIHWIVSEVFRLQRSFDTQVMELHHTVDVERLKAEDVENIKFDLEIMTEVKNWQDQEMDGLKQKLETLQEQSKNSQDAMNSQAEKVKQELEIRHDSQLQRMKQDLEKSHQETLNSFEKQKQVKIDALEDQISLLRDAKSAENGKLESKLRDIEYQFNFQKAIVSQKEEEVKKIEQQLSENQASLKGAREELQTAWTTNKTIESNFQNYKSSKKGEIQDKTNQIGILQRSIEDLKENLSSLKKQISQKDEALDQMSNETDQIVAEFLQRKENYRSQIKTLKEKLIEMASTQDEFTSQEKSQLQSQIGALTGQLSQVKSNLKESEKQRQDLQADLEQKSDQITTELQAEFEQILNKRQEKYEKKSQKLKNLCEELSSQNAILTQQVSDMEIELKSSENKNSSNEETSKNVNELEVQIQELQSEMEKVVAEKDTQLKDQHDKLIIAQKELDESLQSCSQEVQSLTLKFEDQIQEFKVKLQTNEQKFEEKKSDSEQIIEKLRQENHELQSQVGDYASRLQSGEQISKEEIEAVQSQTKQEAADFIEKLKQKRDAKEEKLKNKIELLATEMTKLDEELNSVTNSKLANESSLKELQLAYDQLLEQKDDLSKQKDANDKTIQQFENQISELKNMMSDQESQFGEAMKEQQEKWKSKNGKIKQDFKELLDEFQKLQEKDESDQLLKVQQDQKVNELEKALEILQREKLDLSQSLDITKVQFKSDTSKLEAERDILSEELMEKVRTQATVLSKVLSDFGVNVEANRSESTLKDSEYDSKNQPNFEALIDACKLALQNWGADKEALQKLIDEREEQACEKENLEFQLERVNAELNLLKNRFEKTDLGQLVQQNSLLKEEQSEMKNDFLIKFNSFSQEITTLRGKLSQYEEPSDDMKDSRQYSSGDKNNSTSSIQQIELPTADELDQKSSQQSLQKQKLEDNSQGNKTKTLETSREYRSKYNLDMTRDEQERLRSSLQHMSEEESKQQASTEQVEEVRGGVSSYIASFFLTDSEMKGNQ